MTIQQPEIKEISNVIKKSNQGGFRPGAGRPRKSNEPISIPSREAQIAEVQKQLAASAPGSREAAVFTRQLSLLTKQIKSYARTIAEREQPAEPPIDPNELPASWPADHWKVLVIEHVADGKQWPGSWGKALEEKEREWAESENLTVNQLEDRLRREAAERDAALKALSDEEQRMRCYIPLYDWHPEQWLGIRESEWMQYPEDKRRALIRAVLEWKQNPNETRRALCSDLLKSLRSAAAVQTEVKQ